MHTDDIVREIIANERIKCFMAGDESPNLNDDDKSLSNYLSLYLVSDRIQLVCN